MLAGFGTGGMRDAVGVKDNAPEPGLFVASGLTCISCGYAFSADRPTCFAHNVLIP
jgi:hypothetical protein